VQEPLDLLPERLPRLSLRLGQVGQCRRVTDAGQYGKAEKDFEYLPGGGRLRRTAARQLLRLRRHFGPE
jgi:hypothetical protein